MRDMAYLFSKMVIGLCRKVAALSGQLANRQQGLALASRSLRF
jgi:hypothetical protein